MEDFSNIIKECCPTEKSMALVSQIIPILIGWSRKGPKTYDELIKRLGFKRFSGIGYQLGYVGDVFNKLSELTGEHYPILNALCVKKSTGLPSDGLDYVCSEYSRMTDADKKIFVMGLNKEAHDYEDWDKVLSLLGLKPVVIEQKDAEISIQEGKCCGYGGEGAAHKKMKDFILEHPESVGITSKVKGQQEYILLSGDRIDVYFESEEKYRIAVEVKPKSSPEADILRGIFQCVKYKAVLDAENDVYGKHKGNKTILVLEGCLSNHNKLVSEALEIKVIENFKTLGNLQLFADNGKNRT